MIITKPKYNEPVQWSYDYMVASFNAGTFVQTNTYMTGGVFDAAAKTYTGGLIVGYMYLVYDDASKTNFLASYTKKA